MKRLCVVVGLLVGSVWLVTKAVQTFEVTCAPDADALVSCRYVKRYAGLTWHERVFTPAPDRVTARRFGKHFRSGAVDIRTLSGDKLTVEWLSADEAEAAAARLVRDPRFTLRTTGPRWWFLFLLVTIPVAVSVARPRQRELVTLDQTAPPRSRSK